jgi:hypothetical protein
MGYSAKNTEHSGAKHGNGANWGPKQDAKKESSKIRRVRTRKELRAELEHAVVRDRDLDRETAADWSCADARRLQRP